MVLRLPRCAGSRSSRAAFTTPEGARLAVGDVARLSTEGAREIFSRDQRRVARVTARVAPEAEYPPGPGGGGGGVGVGGASRPGCRPARRRGGGTGPDFSELAWAAPCAAAGGDGPRRNLRVAVASLYGAGVGSVGADRRRGMLVAAGRPVGVMAMLGLDRARRAWRSTTRFSF